MGKSYIIGIAGGSGSGKTTIANKIRAQLDTHVLYIPHDRYYKAQDEKTMAERVKTNYDHPQALETDLLIQHLEELLKGNSVEMPQYDFTHHTRQKECTIEKPSPLILIEGILLFENEQLRDLCDLKAYIDVPADIRILRRIKRDILERGRTIEMCTDQYLAFTRPMHEQFVEPTKGFADIIIPNSGNSDKGVQTIIDTLEKKLQIT